MNSAWTRNLQTEDEKADFEKRLQNSRTVLRRLNELIDGELKGLEASETHIQSYDSPNWAYVQADKNGYKRAARFIKRLIDLDQKENR
jgi:hypothetical protein